MTTYTSFSDFYDASQARNIALGGGAPLGDILTEIDYLKEQIDTAAPMSQLSVTVSNSTVMTNSEDYYNAWADPNTYADDLSVLYRARMDNVVRYFSILGYRVQRQRVNTTNFFQWVVSW